MQEVFQKALEQIPLRYRSGPWSPVAWAYLAAIAGLLAYSYQAAIDSIADIENDIVETAPMLSHTKIGYKTEEEKTGIYSYSNTSMMTTPRWQGEQEQEQQQQQNLLVFRVVFAAWGVFILVKTLKWAPGAIVSFTMTSWNLLWLRMLFAAINGYLGAATAFTATTIATTNVTTTAATTITTTAIAATATGSSTLSISIISILARACKFPALACSTVTVVVWWTVLTPMIHRLIGDKQRREDFWNFNTSFLLTNIHLLNLPIAVVEFYLSKSKFVFFDLWIGFVVVFLYMIFYLFALDAKGIHLYIIFTPRTHWCFVSYSLVLLIFYICYVGWNSTVVL